VTNLVADVLKLGGQTLTDAPRLTRQLLYLRRARLAQDPQEFFALLREVRPVFVRAGMAVVTRYPDVVEVLTHDADFSVEGYAGPMNDITGDFILGLDQGPEYERSVSLLRLAFRRPDVASITELATRAAADCIAAARPSGSIDIVRDLTNRVPARIVAQYLGAPGPDEDTLISWARTLFTHIFVDLNHDRILNEQAASAAADIRSHVDALVTARKSALAAGRPAPDDVLTRLVRQQDLDGLGFTDTEIRSNLIGMLVGMIPTISKASALAVDELLSRPKQLQGARKAALDGDDALFDRYVTEAMRFAPQAPGLLRRAVTDYPLARSSRHETLIRRGTVVFASTQSAMHDPDVVQDPHEFRLDRPDSVYLHYGAGLHACYGRYVNAVVIPAIVKAALSIESAERAPGLAGELTMDGSWPTSMTLRFSTRARR
jgi:cytochrome P450